MQQGDDPPDASSPLAESMPAESMPAGVRQVGSPPADTPIPLPEPVPTESVEGSPVVTPPPPALPPPLPAGLPPPLPWVAGPLHLVPPTALAVIPVSEEEARREEESHWARELADLAAAARPALRRTRQRKVASPFQRVTAMAIDIVACLMLVLFVAVMLKVLTSTGTAGKMQRGDRLITWAVALTACAATLVEVFWSTSPGKVLVGLTIRGTDGVAPSPLRRLIRWVATWGPWLLLLVVFGLSALFIVDAKRIGEVFWLSAVLFVANGAAALLAGRRTLSDRLSRTVVYSDTTTAGALPESAALFVQDNAALPDAPHQVSTRTAAADPSEADADADASFEVAAPTDHPHDSAIAPDISHADSGDPGLVDVDAVDDELARYQHPASSDDRVRPVSLQSRFSAALVEVLVLTAWWFLTLPLITLVLIAIIGVPPIGGAVASVVCVAVLTCGELVGTAGIGKAALTLQIATVRGHARPAFPMRLARYAIKYAPLLLAAFLASVVLLDRWLITARFGQTGMANIVLAYKLPILVAAAIYVFAWLLPLSVQSQCLWDLVSKTAVFDATDLARHPTSSLAEQYGFDVIDADEPALQMPEESPAAISTSASAFVGAPTVDVKIDSVAHSTMPTAVPTVTPTAVGTDESTDAASSTPVV